MIARTSSPSCGDRCRRSSTSSCTARPRAAARTPCSPTSSQGRARAIDAFEPAWLPFDHPLWIVYSSGTTGLPKPIVHGHGGIVIVVLALLGLHNDLGCSYHENSFGERYHWYCSTGWIMWNSQVGGLLSGTTCCIFDGSPGGTKDKPDWTTLWRFVASRKRPSSAPARRSSPTAPRPRSISPRPAICRGCAPRLDRLAAHRRYASLVQRSLRGVVENQRQQAQADIWWANISGGTDFAGAFIGGNRELPQTPGAMQCRLLGARGRSLQRTGPRRHRRGRRARLHRADALDAALFLERQGRCALSRQLFRDLSGQFRRQRPRPVWRHGDWLKVNPDGSCIIYGRSDATINRHGLRMGTSELYSAIEALPEVLDRSSSTSNISAATATCRCSWCCAPGVAFDAAMQAKINKAIEAGLSPRFLPNEILPSPRSRARSRARSRSCRSRSCCWASPSKRSSTGRRWPIPPASTGISPSPATISPEPRRSFDQPPPKLEGSRFLVLRRRDRRPPGKFVPAGRDRRVLGQTDGDVMARAGMMRRRGSRRRACCNQEDQSQDRPHHTCSRRPPGAPCGAGTTLVRRIAPSRCLTSAASLLPGDAGDQPNCANGVWIPFTDRR